MDSNQRTVACRVQGVDETSLPIGPEEAFVLAQVDGKTTSADLALATGLSREQLEGALTRLIALGAIRFEEVDQASEPRPQPRSEGAGASSRLERPAIEAPRRTETPHQAAAALYDPSELDEAAELDLIRKRRILDLFYALDSSTHYEVLGVPRAADKKEIKDAYYDAVRQYHPDRFFGKQLGSFKTKLERIFQRMTEAHDLLTRKKTRDEYDAYLRGSERNASEDRLLSDERARAAEVEQARRRIEETARLMERVARNPPDTAPPASPHGLAPRPISEDERRRALARRLGRSGPPAGATTSSAPPREPPREAVAEDLRRMWEQRVLAARQQQVDQYLATAQDALKRDEAVAAANALRIAASLAPDDAGITALLEQATVRAAADLAQSYVEQAQYEERSGRWLAAARSYDRAVRGKESPRLHERIAHCLLEGEGDVREASDHARRALALAPDNVEYRITLARVYLKAGLRQSAIGEFERAGQIAPNDDNVKSWLRRIKRGEL
ncbi:MAG: DnaJ domain-containing protein [Polyangiaceae bacterium]|nr:DnaJ domain-containing protein [Polyangiaceae bacterium]